MPKKDPSPSFTASAQTSLNSLNPLTPPPSDGSNYSTTPSPNSLHPTLRGLTQSIQQEITSLQSSSVLMSPFSDHFNVNGCSPPLMVSFGFSQFCSQGFLYIFNSFSSFLSAFFLFLIFSSSFFIFLIL